MANITGVGDLQSVTRCRRDKAKRVARHVHVRDRLLNLRHMARDALVALATRFVMGVLLDRRRVRAVRRARAVTIQT